MKKIVSLLCAAAMLVGSLAFVGCQNGASANANNSGSVKAAGTGVVMGYVLDNRGEPVEGATVTLGGSITTTNVGGEFVLSDVPVNVDTAKTATFQYSVTAKKDGYLSAVIPAIAVSYEESQSLETKDYFAALKELSGYYKGILEKYADKAGLTSTQTNVLNPNNDLDTGDFVITTTNEGSGKDNVMQTLANAIKDLERLYNDGNYYTQFYSTFGKAVLIPCDATFKGKVRVTTKVKGSTVYSEDLFVPTSKPVVRVSYTTTSAAVENNKNDYTWKAEVDDKGFFSFEKLPSGVELSVSIDSFYETKDDVEYVWSSASGDIIAENSGAETAGAINKVKLGSADSNETTYSFILYAQNDKLWITASNLGTNTDAALIKTTDPITFTFNKPILKATIEADTGSEALKEDLKTHGYTSELSEDKKTVTFKPVDGNWTGSGAIVVKAEAVDGAKTVLNSKWNVALDDKTWVSFEGKTFSDTDGFLALSSPIVLKFTRAMTDNVTFTIDSTNEYTRTWNEAKTELTLAPTAEAKYWKLKDAQNYIQISKIAGLAADGTKTIDFWKDGSESTTTNNVTTTTLKVYFNNFVDVTLAKADVTGHEAFTITFSKALKSFNAKDAAELVITENKDAGAKTLTLNKDYTVAIDEAKKVITVTSKEAQFPYEGKYKVTFLATLKAEDGSNAFRIAGNKGKEANIAFVTDFSFEGLVFKPVSIEVLDSLPATAVLSRAVISVSADKVLKFTFNRDVQEAKITVKTGTNDAKAKNYIDSADKKVVYVPLESVKDVNKAIVLGGEVTSVYASDDKAEFTTDNLAKWFKNVVDSFYVYSALNLEGTSLVKGLDHVTGKPEYTKADPISAAGTVTFTFDADLSTGYKASYKIFGLKDVDNDKAPADIKVLVENGAATIAGKTVTVTDTAFKTKKTVGDIATYYVELRVDRVDAEGKVLARVFSSTNPYFGSVTNSFEATAKGQNIYNAPDFTLDPNEGKNGNKNYGAFIVEVAEKNHLVATNLIKETKYSLTKSAYAKADALAAKSAITFTFDSLPAGVTASYELYDIAVTDGTKKPQVVTSGAATIADKVVTVKTDLLVSGKPTVEGKVFNVATSASTGISDYFLKLEVKDAAGNVFFSSANKALAPDTGATGYVEKRTDFEKAVESELLTKSDSNAKDMFKVEVAPLAVESVSWVKEDTDAFGVTKLDDDGKKKYKTAEQIYPKAEVTITFNADIPAGSKYTYKITDGSNTVEETKTAKDVAAATKEIKIQSDKLVAKTTTAQDYYIELTVLNGKDKIFATDSTYFGNASNFEKKNNTTVINATKDAFNVKVIQTQIVTKKVNDVESKTTTDDAKGFRKSYKSPIVLQFSHPVVGYKAVLYSGSKLYTDAKDSKTWKAPAEAAGTTPATKYDDFIKDNAEFIYASTVTTATAATATDAEKKLMTITPAGSYGLNKTINIAFFNENGEYVAVKTDEDAVRTYTTANVANDYAKEILADAAALTVETPVAKIGDGKNVIFSVPTELSDKSDKLAVYKLYVKEAEDTAYTDKTAAAMNDAKYGYDSINAVVYGNDTLNENKDGVQGAAVSRENKILGRAGKAYMSYALGLKSFGIRGGKVQLLVISELDGVIKAYKAELSDGVKPETLAVSNVSATWAPATGNVTFASGAGSIKFVTPLGAAGTVTPPTDSTDFSFDITVDGGQIIKSITPEWTSIGASTASPAVASTCKIEVSYNTASDKATISIKNGKFFKGDKIKFIVLDTTGNTADFIFTFE